MRQRPHGLAVGDMLGRYKQRVSTSNHNRERFDRFGSRGGRSPACKAIGKAAKCVFTPSFKNNVLHMSTDRVSGNPKPRSDRPGFHLYVEPSLRPQPLLSMQSAPRAAKLPIYGTPRKSSMPSKLSCRLSRVICPYHSCRRPSLDSPQQVPFLRKAETVGLKFGTHKGTSCAKVPERGFLEKGLLGAASPQSSVPVDLKGRIERCAYCCPPSPANPARGLSRKWGSGPC